jgi:hypothetical protein
LRATMASWLTRGEEGGVDMVMGLVCFLMRKRCAVHLRDSGQRLSKDKIERRGLRPLRRYGMGVYASEN